MSNMGYCRFRNTLPDLHDCYDHLWDDLENNPEEERAREKLVRLCKEIANDYWLEGD